MTLAQLIFLQIVHEYNFWDGFLCVAIINTQSLKDLQTAVIASIIDLKNPVM